MISSPRPRRLPTALLVCVLGFAAVGCGSGGSSASDTSESSDGSLAATTGTPKVVEITMSDIAYDVTSLEFAVGDTVEFHFTNTGKLPHDAYIGDAAAQSEHEDEMKAMPGMHHGDDGEPAVTVDAGTSGTLTYTFEEAGSVQIGCHQSGHYAAGMKVAVTVA